MTTLAVHTVEEAAAILRVKKSWLERQAATRKVPFCMLGGSYRFTALHLAEIVRMNEQMPATRLPDPRAVVRPRARQTSTPRSVMPLRPRPQNGPRRAA